MMMFQSSGREESWELSLRVSLIMWRSWESQELWVRSTHSEHSRNWDRHDNRSRNRTDQFEFCSRAEREWWTRPTRSVPLRPGGLIPIIITDNSHIHRFSFLSCQSLVFWSWQTLAAFNGLCVYSQTRLITL